MKDRSPPRPFILSADDPAFGKVTLEEPLPVPQDPDQETAIEPARPKRRRGLGFWLKLTLASLVLTVLVGQFALWVEDLATSTPWLAWPLGALAGGSAVLGSLLAWRGMQRWRALDQRAELRREATRLVGSELHGEGPALLKRVGSALFAENPGLAPALRRYDAQLHDNLADGERVRLFERVVLEELDQRAVRLVGAAARDIAVLTAVTPTGLLDALVVLTRSFAMLNRLAALYGVPPDRLTTLRLMRLSFRNAALAGVADVLTQATTEHLGASLLSLLSAKAGQGAGNALLASRLGLEAIPLLRPLAFVERTKPRLIDLRHFLSGEPVKPGR